MTYKTRVDGRNFDELRKTTIERNFLKYPEGSVLITQGNTKVIVTASVLEYVPHFLADTGTGWITAEYNMLPRATQTRNSRERERVKGRTYEIQRLIGRCMRAAFNYEKIGEYTIRIDCDVIQADGGTRCASITGAFIAVFDALRYLYDKQLIYEFPDYNLTAAISLGIKDGDILLDLNYQEDSQVDVDVNLVMSEVEGSLEFIEVQGTAEGDTFKKDELQQLLSLGEKGISQLINLLKKELNLI